MVKCVSDRKRQFSTCAAEKTLRSAGIARVDTAKSGESAWQHMQRTYYDLIILDWKIRSPHALGLI